MLRSSPALSSLASFPAPSALPQLPPNVHPLPVRRREDAGRFARQGDRTTAGTEPNVDIWPRETVSRRARSWNGMAAEIIQMTRRERVDVRYRGPAHLLIVVEQGVRSAGETSVEGLPPATLRDLRRKMTFVPAGHRFHEWQQPSLLSRATYIYFDPARLPLELELGHSDALNTPRLFFEDSALWESALKLRRLIENPGCDSRLYLEALGVVLAHELMRPVLSTRESAPARGGLAAWQQRILVDYIEENLAERISLAELAKLVRLSPYHVCRAFKESFGVPPHRYHTGRRIERAKALLAKPDCSVTEIGMAVGFSETSSFSAAFRKATGLTPTAYHRGLR